MRTNSKSTTVYQEAASYHWVKRTGVVYLNGQQIAIQNTANNNTQTVWWFYENPATGSTRGTSTKMGSEPDPLGINNRTSAPIEPPDTSGSVPDFILPQRIVDPSNMANGCQWGGLPISCSSLEDLDRDERHVYSLDGAAPFREPNGSSITVNQGTGFGSSSSATNHGMGAFGVPSDNTPQTIRDPRRETERLHFVGMWQTNFSSRQNRSQQRNLPSKAAIQNAMQSCIDIMFGGNGILVSDFTPSETGIFGKIEFSYVEGEATPKSVTITNDTQKYSISELIARMERPKQLGPVEVLGVTFGTQTTNYTARDRGSKGVAGGIGGNNSSRAKFIATQIHEFGHSLGNLFNKQHTVIDIGSGKEKEETGEAFLNCVQGRLREQRNQNGGFNQ